eukprot:m.51349 g.51349  ORF g.51349 m.51349 type:complete len:322 (+) comp12983_c0_seq1:37-1002(+)
MQWLWALLSVEVIVGTAVFGLVAAYIALYVTRIRIDLRREPGETHFLNAAGQAGIAVPQTDAAPAVDLSVVIPAYKETARLPHMLDNAMAYLTQRKAEDKQFTYEVIIVDDGSRDGTSECALGFSEKFGYDTVRVLRLDRNRGKGGAVRMGMLSARGRTRLMVDADGATQFSDLAKLEKALAGITANGVGIAVGSRSHLEEEPQAKRSLFRTILMHAFHALVYILCVKGIRDTQCGFKLFTRQAALATFSTLHIERWAFDVEVLYIAQQLRVPIAEVQVNWHEVDGSKLDPMWSSLQMGRDLLRIRASYLFGIWKLEQSYI